MILFVPIVAMWLLMGTSKLSLSYQHQDDYDYPQTDDPDSRISRHGHTHTLLENDHGPDHHHTDPGDSRAHRHGYKHDYWDNDEGPDNFVEPLSEGKRDLLNQEETKTRTIQGIEVRQFPTEIKPCDPYELEFYESRMHNGAVPAFHRNDTYGHLFPIVYQFDYLVHICDMNWLRRVKNMKSTSPCLWVQKDRPIESKCSGDSHWYMTIFRDDDVDRIHVFADKLFRQAFLDSVLPRYEGTNKSIIVHTGDADVYAGDEFGKTLLSSPNVARWVVEQTRSKEFINDPRVFLAPTGVAPRENKYDRGKYMRGVLSHIKDVDVRRRLRTVAMNTDYTEPQSYRRLLYELSEHTSDWNDRSDEPYFCFDPSRANRKRLYESIQNGTCTQCVACQGDVPLKQNFDNESEVPPELHYNSEIHILKIWSDYSRHKFVVSPHGNGVDCGRTFEILIMGAIPIVEYFPGVHAYLNQGIDVITINNGTKHGIHDADIERWKATYTHGNERHKMSTEYWHRRMYARPTPTEIAAQKKLGMVWDS